jgi:hypothetical protein
MRSVLPAVLLAAALGTALPSLNAQALTDSIAPRGGTWGAEATYGGGGPGATLIRFSSPRTAWLAGVMFTGLRETIDAYAFPGMGNPTRETHTMATMDARLGHRWWSSDAGARVRPLTGIGVLGALGRYPTSRSWDVGGYAELGATYFFSPHVSLGASGELAAGYGEERSASGFATIPDRVTTHWLLRGSLARISAGVYF